MTWLFLALATFIVNPQFDTIPQNWLSQNVVNWIHKTLEKSNIEKECTVMYLNWFDSKNWLLSYTTYCFQNNKWFKAIIWIDINNLIWIRVRK